MTVDVERNMLFASIRHTQHRFLPGVGTGRARTSTVPASLVALDANTGKLKWYFQTVHHDNWDYDDNSAPILITVHKDGKSIPAIEQIASKNGFMFILDRRTGKPIFGVNEGSDQE